MRYHLGSLQIVTQWVEHRRVKKKADRTTIPDTLKKCVNFLRFAPLLFLRLHMRSLIYAKVHFYRKIYYEPSQDEDERVRRSWRGGCRDGMHCVHFSEDFLNRIHETWTRTIESWRRWACLMTIYDCHFQRA